jgi:hypothetical protein
MRKLILILSVYALVSCEKEETTPPPVAITEQCQCGEIVQQQSYTTTYNNVISVLNAYRVKNECTGNVSDWYYSTDMFYYTNSEVGKDYCLSATW